MEAGTEVKERIVARAFDLFRQYGIKTISMADIAVDLGISKKTLYKWFSDKDELVAETVTAYLQEVKNICTGAADNPVEEFCSAINLSIQRLLHLHTAFFYDLKKYYQPAYQIWLQYKQEHIVQLFQDNFLRGVQSGLYRSDLNPDVTARLYVGQLQSIYYSDLFPPAEYNRQETYQQNLKHFVLGLVSKEGYKILSQVQLKHCN
ncbi:TetR family transcriptional regulator [Adhaeribacter aerolatus]|uniref:TetR family transcriptional regulator n=1 Tax=Adhaeribacter aerolatus TaxID=670289 RepID=A0A512B2U6_9BACT|nr:TetR/AcrR family transcriptional regulator [Adhaeribacter aerolatus]GEO06264.1 TetR family transcriptional regulator [Adhaeribacter aerolatus]